MKVSIFMFLEVLVARLFDTPALEGNLKNMNISEHDAFIANIFIISNNPAKEAF